jgi:hypothetical protein
MPLRFGKVETLGIAFVLLLFTAFLYLSLPLTTPIIFPALAISDTNIQVCSHAGCNPKLYEATVEWSQIQVGQIIPNPLAIEVQIKDETGERFGRLSNNETFVPSYRWQIVHDQIFPPGLDFEVDMQTTVKKARLMPPREMKDDEIITASTIDASLYNVSFCI